MRGVEEYDYLYKIILVGDATVGKTHLLSRYIKGSLPRSPKATIGVEFATRTIPLSIGGTVKAQIWDTAGQERYRSITSAHYRRAVGALLVYDITRKITFLNASKWLEELRINSEPDIVIMLVGNKYDLVADKIDDDNLINGSDFKYSDDDKSPNMSKREVPYDLASNYAEQNGLLFAETSAITNHNVHHVFERLLQEIYNQKSKVKFISRKPSSKSESLEFNNNANNYNETIKKNDYENRNYYSTHIINSEDILSTNNNKLVNLNTKHNFSISEKMTSFQQNPASCCQ